MGKSKDFTQFGSDLAILEAALVDRLKDAMHLFTAGRWASSIALNLYAFEIALKVQIRRRIVLPRGRKSTDSYVMVRRSLEESLKDTQETLLAMGLIVQSSVQMHSGGIYGIGSEYHEIDLESFSVHV